MISIVIPAFNSAYYIPEAVASSLEVVRHVGGEVIVVDDGSTDSTAKVLEPFLSEICFHQIAKSGACVARNHGLSQCKCPFVKFLDADDVLIPDAVIAQLRHAESLRYESEISYGFALEIDLQGKIIGKRRPEPVKDGDDPVAHMLRNNPVISSPLHPRKAIERIKGFDTTLKRGQETNLHLRLALAGYTFRFLDRAIFLYRQHGIGGTNITSGSYTKFGPQWPLQYLQNHHKLIVDSVGSPLPSEVSQALAISYWEVGRGILRDGYPDVALQAFDEARTLSASPYAGSVMYQNLVKLFGPFLAERLVGLPKKLLSS